MKTILDTSAVNWSKVYENNYLATLETKLCLFRIRLNTRSIVTNIQLHGLKLLKVIYVYFVPNHQKIYYTCFVIVLLSKNFGMASLIG